MDPFVEPPIELAIVAFGDFTSVVSCSHFTPKVPLSFFALKWVLAPVRKFLTLFLLLEEKKKGRRPESLDMDVQTFAAHFLPTQSQAMTKHFSTFFQWEKISKHDFFVSTYILTSAKE